MNWSIDFFLRGGGGGGGTRGAVCRESFPPLYETLYRGGKSLSVRVLVRLSCLIRWEWTPIRNGPCDLFQYWNSYFGGCEFTDYLCICICHYLAGCNCHMERKQVSARKETLVEIYCNSNSSYSGTSKLQI